ncbi:STT3 domain-containing protein [Saccharolobus islandicus]|uniref:dolichyl-phosphooligosaccharide-protein glycotransferase n=2 Tax=Saccharolobus islandicus TaxID=43080 RepID=F0NGU2_SACI5|nr:STT3 domain-containing protein [Sulfolobus islandicus]ADX82476.1 oligosaccharyl transferase STT3 subunit [Sulfolobus islandicus HVE10/4]ADX85108.1 oligosaccharyl transferase STT3 subunit [Sulfolobus islandicus REY15A]WCM36237.1 peptide transporter [Sulfolobus islandicus]
MQSVKGLRRDLRKTSFIDLPLIVGLSLVSILIRSLSANWPLAVNEFDPWYLFYNALLIAQVHGNWYAVPPDVLGWFPWGYFIELGNTIGLPFLVALASLPFYGTYGANAVYTVAIFSDILLAGLGVVASYLSIESITNSRLAGYMAAAIIAVSPALTYKNLLGGLPKTSWGAVFILFAIFLFNQGLKKKNIWYGVPAGFVLFLAEISWGGYTYIDLSLLVAAFLLILLNRNDETTANLYTIMVVVTSFLTSLAPNNIGFMSGLAHGLSLLLISAVLYLDLYLSKTLPKEIVDSRNLIVIAVLIFIFTIGLSGLSILRPTSAPIPSRYYAIINPFYQVTIPIDKTVAEYIPQPITAMIQDFGIALFLSVIGMYYLIRKGNLVGLWLLVLGVASIFGTSQQPYLFNYTAYMVAALGGLGVYYIADNLLKGVKNGNSSKILVGFFLAIVGISLVADAGLATLASNEPPAITNAATSFLTTNYSWVSAANWIRTHSPQHAFVLSWWDYGYWLEVLTNRSVIDENNTLNGTQIKLMAEMFLNNETFAANVLEKYFHLYPYGSPNYTIPVYIVAYDAVTLVYFGNQAQWYVGYPPSLPNAFFGYTTSLGDIGKAMGAMTTIAGYPLEEYINLTELNNTITQIINTYATTNPTIAQALASQVSQAEPFAWTPKAYNSLIVQMFIESLYQIGYGQPIAPFTTQIIPSSSGYIITGSPLPRVQLMYFQPAYIALFPVGNGGAGGVGYTTYIMVMVYQFTQPGVILKPTVVINS